MKELFCKIKYCGVSERLKKALSSKYFPFATAIISLVCYYLGWDIVNIYYAGLTGILILLLLDDITPLFSVFLFMNVMVSLINSPSYTTGGSDYYSRTAIMVQIIVVIVAFVSAIIYRTATTFTRNKFKLTPIFFGLCALSVFFLLNGVLCEDYNPLNLVYGVFMVFFYLVVFALMKDNVAINSENFVKIAFAFLALSAYLLLELSVQYIANDIIADGTIKRNYIVFGWGIWNTMGMLLLLCIPAVMYLAGRYRHGYPFLIYAAILACAAVLTCSRQTLVGVVIIFPLCFIILIIKGKSRLYNLLTAGAILVIILIVLFILRDSVVKHFEIFIQSLFKNGKPQGSRYDLWVSAVENFKTAPWFGNGFYDEKVHASEMVGLKIIPLMYHDTLLQILASCGIFALIAYIVHRVQTVISFFRNITVERTFIAVTILALLIVSIFDNHMFYILPTLVYTSLLAILVKSEKKEPPQTPE